MPHTGEASFLAARLLIAQGVDAGVAHTVGNRAAQYAVGLTFATLRAMGAINEEGIDPAVFAQTAQTLVRQSGVKP